MVDFLSTKSAKYDWEKLLSQGEVLKRECGLGERFLRTGFAVSLAVGIVLLPFVVGFLIIPWSFFYWKFYLKKAFCYALTDRRVLVHRGWLSTKLVSIDYRK